MQSKVRVGVAALVVALGIAGRAAAQDGAIAEVRSAWNACSAVTESAPDDWVGWRHDFFNGYGNNFRFYDRRWSGGEPSVLLREIATDGIFWETITSCFREDGTLAFIFTTASSPNYADGGDMGPMITREGRIYFNPDGEVIRTLGQIVDESGKVVVKDGVDTDRYALARGCSPVTVHRTADEVEREYFSVLGEIDGTRPEFAPDTYDWCGAVAE